MQIEGNVWEILSTITGIVALVVCLYLEREKLSISRANAVIRSLRIGACLLSLAVLYLVIGFVNGKPQFPLLDLVYQSGPYLRGSGKTNAAILISMFIILGGSLGRIIARSTWSMERKFGILLTTGAISGSILAIVFFSQIRSWRSMMTTEEWPTAILMILPTAIHTAIGTIIAAFLVAGAMAWRLSHVQHVQTHVDAPASHFSTDT